jgi:hypothetical protein
MSDFHIFRLPHSNFRIPETLNLLDYQQGLPVYNKA